MPSSSPNLVIGSGSSGAFSIGGSALGCLTDLSDNGTRATRSYQTLCDDVAGYEQKTPGALSRVVSATAEFLAGGAGIAAADNALEGGALTTCTRTFAGQTSGTDAKTYSGFVTGVNKQVSSGSATGTVAVTFDVVAPGTA